MSLLNDSRAIFSAQNHTPSDSYCSLPVFRKWSLRSLPPPCWLLMPLWCTSVSLDTTTESWNEPLWNPFFLGGGSELPWWQVLDVSGSLYVYIYIYVSAKKIGALVIVEKWKLHYTYTLGGITLPKFIEPNEGVKVPNSLTAHQMRVVRFYVGLISPSFSSPSSSLPDNS